MLSDLRFRSDMFAESIQSDSVCHVFSGGTHFIVNFDTIFSFRFLTLSSENASVGVLLQWSSPFLI